MLYVDVEVVANKKKSKNNQFYNSYENVYVICRARLLS